MKIGKYGRGRLSDRCVDIFRRPGGPFAFEEFRRDVKDASGWSRPTEQRMDLPLHVGQGGRRQLLLEFGLAPLPVEALDLIGKNKRPSFTGERYLERIALRLARHRATHH